MTTARRFELVQLVVSVINRSTYWTSESKIHILLEPHSRFEGKLRNYLESVQENCSQNESAVRKAYINRIYKNNMLCATGVLILILVQQFTKTWTYNCLEKGGWAADGCSRQQWSRKICRFVHCPEKLRRQWKKRQRHPLQQQQQQQQ